VARRLAARTRVGRTGSRAATVAAFSETAARARARPVSQVQLEIPGRQARGMEE